MRNRYTIAFGGIGGHYRDREEAVRALRPPLTWRNVLGSGHRFAAAPPLALQVVIDSLRRGRESPASSRNEVGIRGRGTPGVSTGAATVYEISA